jgi:hypothetical protein
MWLGSSGPFQILNWDRYEIEKTQCIPNSATFVGGSDIALR